jgi:hypothetical protein
MTSSTGKDDMLTDFVEHLDFLSLGFIPIYAAVTWPSLWLPMEN